MVNKHSSSDAVTHVHLLRNYVLQMESTFKQLDHSVAKHVTQLDKILNKVGGKTVHARVAKKLSTPSTSPLDASSLFSNILQSSKNTANSSVRRQNQAMGLSNRQLMSDFASAISRSIKRDL